MRTCALFPVYAQGVSEPRWRWRSLVDDTECLRCFPRFHDCYMHARDHGFSIDTQATIQAMLRAGVNPTEEACACAEPQRAVSPVG